MTENSARRGKSVERSIKDFEILQRLGEGSFGVAFKVRDKRSGEVLVMKQIKFDENNPGELQSKMSECQLIKDLHHPYICRFRYCFTEN